MQWTCACTSFVWSTVGGASPHLPPRPPYTSLCMEPYLAALAHPLQQMLLLLLLLAGALACACPDCALTLTSPQGTYWEVLQVRVWACTVLETTGTVDKV